MTRRGGALLVLGALVAVTGCAPDVEVDAAPLAADPSCAEVVVRLPDTLAGEHLRNTASQSTAAWGNPASIILTCGLPPVAASELSCETVDGVDWLIDPTDDPRIRFTSFGRSPAVEVYVDYDSVSGADVLRELSSAVSTLPSTGAECTERPTE